MQIFPSLYYRTAYPAAGCISRRGNADGGLTVSYIGIFSCAEAGHPDPQHCSRVSCIANKPYFHTSFLGFLKKMFKRSLTVLNMHCFQDDSLKKQLDK